MNREYWTKKLRDAEADLEAATKLTDVNTAAKRLMRAKAELKELEQASKPRPKRRATHASASAGASA